MGAARASRVIGALCATVAIAIGAVAILAGRSAVAAPDGRGTHEGVASCAESSCHSRQVDSGLKVRQNERITWQDPSSPAGAHSRAYKVLSLQRGQAILRKMGERPGDFSQCIGCHSDPAPPALQGAKFRHDDGVGCEACHGGSSGWLASHRGVRLDASGAPVTDAKAHHEGNIANGLRRLEDPKERASVCLDCHFGGTRPGQFVTHEIMAAGHPRVSFELDLFSSLIKHWDVDADYMQRKTYANGVRTWAVGQAMAVERSLSLYQGPARGQGAFPEFYFFDCHSCHREIKDDPQARPAWQANPGRPIRSGQPPYNDENMIMLTAAAKAVAPGLASRFEADSRAFHAAVSGEKNNAAEAVRAAGRLATSARALSDEFARHEFSRGQTLAILDAVLTGEIAKRYTDYAGSAQAVMAAETLLNAMVSAGQADRGAVDRIRPALANAYAQVRDPNAYRPDAFRASLAQVAQAARSLK